MRIKPSKAKKEEPLRECIPYDIMGMTPSELCDYYHPTCDKKPICPMYCVRWLFYNNPFDEHLDDDYLTE